MASGVLRWTSGKGAWLAMAALLGGCFSTPDSISMSQTTLATEVQETVSPTVSSQPKETPTTQIEPSQQPDSTSPTEGAVPTAAPAPPTENPGAEQPPSTVPPPAAIPDDLQFTEVARGSRSPIFLTAAPGAEHSYLAEQGGRILHLVSDGLSDQPVLDISGKVTFRGEQGLLGIALHPTDPTRLFVHYSNRRGDTVVSEFSLSDDGMKADPDSEKVIFFAEQPATNHNGGMIQFGPDGYLYLGLGDGGRAGDHFGHGQRPDTPLAALVRIHPDHLTSEVWWYGLRNPWRFWIDQPTGATYIADVGQDAYEEISVATLSIPGLNFGWPITEGLNCYEPRQDCDTTGLTLPVLEVNHGDGNTCSITGGVVYRGASMPGLWGHYFYSDYCGGYIRSFRWTGTLATDLREWAPDLGRVVSFGIDGSGEMYVLTTDSVLRINPLS